MKKIRIDNTLIIDYSEEKIDELIETNTPYEVGYICDDCGCFTPEVDINMVTNREGGKYPVCDSCIMADEYFYCECCNTYYDDSVASYGTSNGDIICEDCYDNYYITCSECNEIIHRDDAFYCDECNQYFCQSCWDEHEHEDDLLYDYHAFNNWQPHELPNEEPAFYIGHELEIDKGEFSSEVINLITSKIPAICMHDGSLSSKGIEIISHPLSYDYYLSLEQEYRDLFTTLVQDYSYKSHDTSTCGLHFHVSRPTNPDIIDRIILFMETYKDEIITLSRRNRSEIDSWCNFLSDRNFGTDEKTLKSLDYIKKHKETSSRYMALNLTNSNTIEFRIFKGTLKYETFMADLEFVYNLVTLASDLSIPVEELTWTRVTSKGYFLPQYVDEHNLHTDKPLIDYTTEILIARNREKEALRKELNTLYKRVVNIIHELTTLDKRKKQPVLIDVSNFDMYSSWLQSLVRDITTLDDIFGTNDNYYIDQVKNRVKFMKERMM